MADDQEVETTEQETETVTQNGETPKEKLYPESYVKKIHTENAARRKREEELATKLKAFEDKELAAETDLKKKVDQYEKRVKELDREYSEKLAARDHRLILSEAKRLAKEAGMIDVDDIRTLDLADLRMDESDDSVPGLSEKIAELKTAKPHWFRQEKTQEEQTKDQRNARTAPPARRDSGTEVTKDWGSASEDEFRKHMSQFGVTI